MSAEVQKQQDYSRQHPDAVFNQHQREHKARKITAILEHALGGMLEDCVLLDLGAGGGAIPCFLAERCRRVVGLEIDATALRHAASVYKRENLQFLRGDALRSPFPDEAFDLVVCAHVYEHVADAPALLDEIHRLLRPGGLCLFAAGNRWMLRECHHGLWFLSWLPRPLANHYMRLAGKGPRYEERHLTLSGLRHLVRRFQCEDYTLRVIADPRHFRAEDVLPAGAWKTRLASLFARRLYHLIPTYLWVLRKSEKE